ncbi:hypothetical protein DRN67_03710 [Candidatus Micrarchaeota archaeon]|nr:MAG: hypothetical protein DRN67_03710 [Candidatus Micrarchaeota archaeon]
MRGQGSVEFLLTNTWALFVIVLVIGALIVLGLPTILNSEPERCDFPLRTLACNDIYVGNGASGGRLAIKQLEMKNQFSKTVYICNLLCTAQSGTPSSQPACGGTGFAIEPGETGLVVQSWLFGLAEAYCRNEQGSTYTPQLSSLYRGNLHIYYSYANEDSGNAHLLTGELVQRVERGG